jgi:hypothetical protein
MSLSPEEKRELLSLLAAISDQAITPAELLKLRQWCASDSAARQIYLDHMFLEALLHWSQSEELGAVAPGVDPAQRSSPLNRSAARACQDSGASTTSDARNPLVSPTPLTTADAEWFIREVPLTGEALRQSPATPQLNHDALRPNRLSPVEVLLARRFVSWSLTAAAVVTLLSMLALSLVWSPEPAAAKLIAVAQPRWGGNQPLALGASLPAGKVTQLEYGAAEFKFPGSATVLIHGPAEFEIVSGNRLRLKAGDLTAHVPPRAIGFVVDSPGLVITDLGTEFFASVGVAGKAQLTVLEGRVEVAESNGASGPAGRQQLIAGETVGRELFGAALRAVPAPALDQIPRHISAVRAPLALHNTGQGLRLGDPDPQWLITGTPRDPHCAPQPVVVSEFGEQFLANDPLTAQWIAPADALPGGAAGTYVFEYSFDLPMVDPNTVVIRAQVLVDNEVRQLRLNGRDTGLRTPPDRDWMQNQNQYFDLLIKHGFVAGRNRLEFDVANVDEGSPVCLRILLDGSGCLLAEQLAEP